LLRSGDRITAGKLVIFYDPASISDSEDQAFRVERRASYGEGRIISLKQLRPEQTLVLQSGPLEAVLRAGQELSAHQPVSELIPAILDLALLAVSAQRGVLMLLEGGKLVTKAHHGACRQISATVRDRVLIERTSVLVRDVRQDSVLKDRRSIVDSGVHTILAVPLLASESIIGLLYADSPVVEREFTEDDLRLLSVMANVAAARIEQARLSEIELADKKLQDEIEQAAEIQRCVLPDQAPAVAGLEAAGFNLPCRTVGGDYYSFFEYANGRLGAALGDVSGKGMPAALMMMGLDARVQVLAEQSADLGELMARLNNATCHRYPTNRFITFVFCTLDGISGEVRCVNAGNGLPILVRASGAAETINESSLVLGVLPNESYCESRQSLGEGDLVVLYSDGITEATNTCDEEFGMERLLTVLVEHRGQRACEIVEAVKRALAEFFNGAPMTDDITLVVVKRVQRNGDVRM
jgi:serine phosphatase RsbU (regulator of sigma subunit)